MDLFSFNLKHTIGLGLREKIDEFLNSQRLKENEVNPFPILYVLSEMSQDYNISNQEFRNINNDKLRVKYFKHRKSHLKYSNMVIIIIDKTSWMNTQKTY